MSWAILQEKISIQKSIVFLYASNEQLKTGIFKNTVYYNSIKQHELHGSPFKAGKHLQQHRQQRWNARIRTIRHPRPLAPSPTCASDSPVQFVIAHSLPGPPASRFSRMGPTKVFCKPPGTVCPVWRTTAINCSNRGTERVSSYQPKQRL